MNWIDLPDRNTVTLFFSFLLFMGIFAGVGLASIWVKKDTTDDYLVAGRGMHPALAALSAVSTWNSGYMFIGFIGFIFLHGYAAIWIAGISTIGQLVAWIWLYKYIQKEGSERNLRSLSSLVSSKAGAPEAKLAAILSVFFLAIYAAAQLTAGGVALNSMIERFTVNAGIMIGFVLVVAYCYAGGIRASIWTDAAQSTVMIVGSTILCVVALGKVGGLGGLHDTLATMSADDPSLNLVNIFPSGLMFGVSLWIMAFFLGGLGVAGQPQVVSRVMTLKDDSDRKQAMVWFFVWQTPFIVLMFLIGLACRAIFPEMTATQAETGLPTLAESLNPFLGGVILASIFAATMSTADSQVLACTAAITDDIKPEWKQDHGRTKMVTVAVAALATGISLVGQRFPGFGDSVFALVVFAVYGLGGIFVPLILIRMMGYEPDSDHTIAMMVAALLGVLIWTVLGFGDEVFPSVPGMGAAFAVHFGFCMKHDKTDKRSNPFGRPLGDQAKKFMSVGAAVLLLSVISLESTYVLKGPNDDGVGGKVGSYQVTGNTSYHIIAEETQYIDDGASIDVMVMVDEDGEFEDFNIVGVRISIAHIDDESQTGPGCLAAEPPQDDVVEASYAHKQHNGSQSTPAPLFDYEVTWYNESLLGSTVNNTSEADLEQQLEGGESGFGEHMLTLRVEVQTGGGVFCESEDAGEEVTYRIELIHLDYEIDDAN